MSATWLLVFRPRGANVGECRVEEDGRKVHDLGNALIRDADKKSVVDIAKEVAEKAGKIRRKEDTVRVVSCVVLSRCCSDKCGWISFHTSFRILRNRSP